MFSTTVLFAPIVVSLFLLLLFNQHQWRNSVFNQIYVPIAVYWFATLLEWYSSAIENRQQLVSSQLINLLSFLLLSKTIQCALFMLFFVLAESPELSSQIGIDFIVVLSHLLGASIIAFFAIYFFTIFLIANNYGISIISLSWPRLLFGGLLSVLAAYMLLFVGGLLTAFALLLTLALVERRRTTATSTIATIPLKSTNSRDRAKHSTQQRVRFVIGALLALILVSILVEHTMQQLFNANAFFSRTVFVLISELVHALTIRMLCDSFSEATQHQHHQQQLSFTATKQVHSVATV